jgi:L-ascorbate metabolism protein UlaG (beta-lactamase superfamily)
MSQTQVTWYGHAAFQIATSSGKVLLIDPWITNPMNPRGKEDVAKLQDIDLVLLTHGHGDHITDAVEIGKRTGAKLVANHDLAMAMTSVLGYPSKQSDTEMIGHIGGSLSLLDGELTVCFVPALHGSTVRKDENSLPISAGSPTGFVISIRNGPTIYHTGDTDLFSDMQLISRYNKIDIMMVCIGDHFTMGPKRAADAVKLVGPARVIPMHYATFPVLTGTPEAFDRELKERGIKAQLREMRIGETISV